LDLHDRSGIPNFHFVRKIRLLFLGFVVCCQTAEAVVIALGGPNNTALSGPQNFSNVGTLSGASATFLTTERKSLRSSPSHRLAFSPC
jgi:hypothetical protein